MNRLYYITVIIILFIACLDLHAKEIDSLKIINSRYDSILISEELGTDKLFYKHHKDVLINNLGPFGSFFYFPSVDFLYKKNILESNDLTFVEFKKLKGVKPFTNLTYINASRKEQIFKIKHIQNFGKQIYFSFNLDKVSSPGAFINQEANNTFFSPTLEYHTKNNNYEIVINSEVQRDFFEENGGLFNPSTYEERLFDDEQNYAVNLRSSNTYLKRYKFNLLQKLDLMRWKKDSLSKKTIFISHKTSYETRQRVFFDNDPNSKIYKNKYLDSLQILQILTIDAISTTKDSVNYDYLNNISNQPTIDSTSFKNFSNTLFVGCKVGKTKYELLYQYDVINYYQGFSLDTIFRNFDTNYVNNYVGIGAALIVKNMIGEGIVKYGVSGYRKGDVQAELKINKIGKKYNFNLNGIYFLSEPDLKIVNYKSNHFNWINNNYNKESTIGIGVNGELKKYRLKIGVEQKLINNAFYYDSLSLASQYNDEISMSSFKIAKEYSIWNFHFRTAGIYQITSNKYIAPLPKVIARQIMYYENRIFKKALKFQFGVGASYSTDYYGYGYSPAISEFTVQQNQIMGYYPSIDIFLNTYLKRAQIFLKWEHYNSGRSNYKSFLAPDYPRLSRSMKFGISWNMFD